MMDPHQFLEVADELSRGLREAEWWSAVSRAYYAAFHVAGGLLETCGFRVPQADQAHGYLWLRLSNSGHPDIDEVGRHLGRLRSDRNWADYDLHRSLPQQVALSSVSRASDIIKLLDLVAAEEAYRSRLTEGVKRYERDVLREVAWGP
jgi:uncharacterized protein (UPF0332 family)